MPAKKPIEVPIVTVRSQRVVLDSDLAALYGVSTGRFNEAVKRNLKRFPEDFSFQLTAEEQLLLISQNAISKPEGRGGGRNRRSDAQAPRERRKTWFSADRERLPCGCFGRRGRTRAIS